MYKYNIGMKTTKRALEVKKDKLISKIAELGPWIEGTIVTTTRICGKKNCACHKGTSKHPVMYVTWKENGKTVSLYVPRKLEDEVRRWGSNYKRLKKLVREISGIQKDIVRLRENG